MKKLLSILSLLIFIGTTNAELVALWNLDENSGNTVYDSQNNHDGTIHGADWDSGKFGSALSFNSDYVDIGNHSTLENFPQVTIATWIYWTGRPKPGANYDSLVGKELVYKIDLDDSHIRFLTSNDWAGSILTSNMTLSNNTWYHIAAVYDGTEKRLYINGTQDLNTVSTSGAIGTRSFSFTMGAQPNTDGAYEDYFRGKIDDVRIYNHGLTEEEIQSLLVPEPGTLLLVAGGALCLRRKRKRNPQTTAVICIK